MNAVFWIIQLVLLIPVLFMAVTAGMEGRSPGRRLTAAVSGLSQFTAEQQARLFKLRAFVQGARVRGGPLSDDLRPASEAAVRILDQPGVALASERRRWQSLLRGFAAVLVTIGAVGIIRTNMAMDGLAAADTALGSTRPLAPAQRFLPGVLANPARYVSAMNAAVEGVSDTTWADPLRTFALLDAKVAMDRWEALAGAGVSLALFANAVRAARHGEAGAIAFDLAPLITVATVLFAALSFCELP